MADIITQKNLDLTGRNKHEISTVGRFICCVVIRYLDILSKLASFLILFYLTRSVG